MDGIWSAAEKNHIESTFRFSVIGGRVRVRELLQKVVELTRADEIMICSEMYDLEDRLKSFEILAST